MICGFVFSKTIKAPHRQGFQSILRKAFQRQDWNDSVWFNHQTMDLMIYGKLLIDFLNRSFFELQIGRCLGCETFIFCKI